MADSNHKIQIKYSALGENFSRVWKTPHVPAHARTCWLWCTAIAEATSLNSTKHVMLRCPRTCIAIPNFRSSFCHLLTVLCSASALCLYEQLLQTSA